MSHQTLQIHCCRRSRSHLCGAGSLPWLGCPCRDSCTLGTWDRTDTSSHCPCRWTPPLNCRQYSWELPGQNVLAGTQAGWPEDLKEIKYYGIKCRGILQPNSLPNLHNQRMKNTSTIMKKETVWLFKDSVHISLAVALSRISFLED